MLLETQTLELGHAEEDRQKGGGDNAGRLALSLRSLARWGTTGSDRAAEAPRDVRYVRRPMPASLLDVVSLRRCGAMKARAWVARPRPRTACSWCGE